MQQMRRTKENFSTAYEKEKIIEANKDTLIYYLQEKEKWLEDMLNEHKYYDKFINTFAKELETYQKFMFLKGSNVVFLKERNKIVKRLTEVINGDDDDVRKSIIIRNGKIEGMNLFGLKKIADCFFDEDQLGRKIIEEDLKNG